jgi:serine protease Do
VNGPAARAGFAQSDVILSVNGHKISKRRDLLLALAALPIGQRVEVDVWREGADIALWPVIGEMPTDNTQTAATGQLASQTQTKNFIIGLNLVPLTKVRSELLDIPPNVRGALVLSLGDDSALLESGIRPGDLIESINQQPVTSPAEAKARLHEALASARKNVLMLIYRNGTNRYLAVSPQKQAERAGRALNGWREAAAGIVAGNSQRRAAEMKNQLADECTLHRRHRRQCRSRTKSCCPSNTAP